MDFRKTLIIMTSNVGARRLAGEGRVGFSSAVNQDGAQQEAMSELKRLFRPEFLNRVDEVIRFEPLTRDEVGLVARRMLADLQERVADLGYTLTIGEEVAPWLAEQTYDPAYGARPLRRAVQTRVEDPLAERLLDGTYRKGDAITLTLSEGELIFEKA